MPVSQFRGSIPALVTPFKEGRVDDAAFQRFVAWQVEQGSYGVVACGTTGESATLDYDEHIHVIRLAVEAAEGRVPVIAGTGSNATAEAIDLTQRAAEAGADAALLVLPYYNKPTQEGLVEHFRAIHDATELPLILYTVPSRTASDIAIETVARLAELPRIVGIKDATGDLARPVKTRLACGADFQQISGEDATVLAFLAQGGVGTISVTANAAPKLMADLHAAWFRGDRPEAERLRDLLQLLHQALFSEVSPGPVKYACKRLGLMDEAMRLPLVPISPATREAVDRALAQVGLI